MEKMKVYPLNQRPRYLNQVAEWLHLEWGIKTDGNTFLTIKTKLETFNNLNTIPLNFIALEGKELVGTFNIMPFDPPSRKDLSPWFASLYVAPQYRRHGIGTMLVKFAVSKAKTMGFQKLYLCTPNRQQMYAKLGWKPIDEVAFRDEAVTIMEFSTHNMKSSETGI